MSYHLVVKTVAYVPKEKDSDKIPKIGTTETKPYSCK